MIHIDDKVISDISRGFSIPAQPVLLLKLQDLMAEKEPDLNKIADAIAEDVAVSATIIKTINSPLYGLARTVSDIKKSVRYIGIQGIHTLVTSTLIKQSVHQNQCSIALDDFWNNATNIANTAVFINKSLRQKVSSEKLFSLGLFHDCGIPVMAMKYPDYQETLTHADHTPSESLTEIEESVYQVNHATLGYYVASSWRLPKDLCRLILQHHDRAFLHKLDGSEMQKAFAILKLAENMVYQHKHFRDCADWAYVQDSVMTVLDIDDENIQDMLEDINDLLD